MKKVLLALLLSACAHSGIKHNTFVYIDRTPFNPTSNLNESCTKNVLYTIEGEVTNAQLTDSTLSFQLSSPSKEQEFCLLNHCLGRNFTPTQNTFYHTSNYSYLQDLENLLLDFSINEGQRIRVIGCSYQSEGLNVLAIQTNNYSIIFNNPRNQIGTR